MKNLLEYLVKSIVKNKKDVRVTEEEKEGYLSLRLSVGEEDTGIVIGKGGRMIKALRNILKVRAIRESKRIYIELTSPQKD